MAHKYFVSINMQMPFLLFDESIVLFEKMSSTCFLPWVKLNLLLFYWCKIQHGVSCCRSGTTAINIEKGSGSFKGSFVDPVKWTYQDWNKFAFTDSNIIYKKYYVNNV